TMSKSSRKLQTKHDNAKWVTDDDPSESDDVATIHPLDDADERKPLKKKEGVEAPKTLKEKIKYYITPQHDWRYYSNPKNYFLFLLTIGVILIGTTNRIMFKKMLYPMANYGYPLSQLTTFIYIPVFWPIVWYF